MTDAQKLILSNASGDTPDIATGINYSIPFDLAIRGSLVDLSKFDNYKEVFGRYSEGLLVPSVVGEGLYSLPETMNFYVMFYRTDILSKLGLSVPNTMDELIAMLPDLQMRGLNVYYPTAAMLVMRNFHGTTPIIYQMDGALYGDTALDILVDSEATVEGFTELTELFTLYDLPVDVPNFYQHFRNGDLPIGIADFNSYNLILNAAPEIANSWSIALVPGIEDEETGEDIATGINYSIPFDLAIRGSLVDLSKFDNYKEVFGRYSEGLLVPSVVGEGLYSLPETMNFYVMFYRTDILSKLGLSVPNTMDELIAMLPDLQMRGLNVYYPTAAMLVMRNFHGTTPIIYQMDGALYGDTALDILVDSEATVEGFTELTELFTLYDLPVDVPNFYQHFRNGDLPIGIADFNSYNLILNAAPEIANSWSIALVPGIEDEETGEVKRYMSGGAESTVMFSSDDEREQKAWQFMEWWSRADIQAEFGQRLQILYGDEYIWPTANLEAFERLPYPTSDKDIILTQAQYILETPRLLGSYMMERELSNAFNDVVVNGDTVRSRIDEVAKTVLRETERKLEEFGYIDSDGNVLKEYEVPSVEKVLEILNRE